jgi:hypothetical protein
MVVIFMNSPKTTERALNPSKSPSIPLFQRGNLAQGVDPLFEKEGKGRVLGGIGGITFRISGQFCELPAELIS